ncbi:MAG TPA: DUF2469 domain-containing protein [Actinomycetota bacterium]|nr:DUF2469 domain-containing protein [Actinomycetota bacterium]
MSLEELEKYEAEMELALYREYRDVIPMFRYLVETERRFYLANKVDVDEKRQGEEIWFEVTLSDAWVWDMYRQSRFVPQVRIITFEDVNIEELRREDEMPGASGGPPAPSMG